MSLFKYVAAERLDVLTHRRIRFTPHTKFNDPFELKPYLVALTSPETLKAYLEANAERLVRTYFGSVPPEQRWGLPMEALKPYLDAMRPNWYASLEGATKNELPQSDRNLSEYLERKLGILSLSRADSDILMWAHYSDGHQGMVIEFNEGHPWFTRAEPHPANPNYHKPLDVVYSVGRYETNLESLDVATLFKTKSEHWIYEQEVRVIRPLEEADKVVLLEDTELYLFSIPPECFVSLRLGCRMSADRRRAITQIVRSDPGLAHVAIRVMELHKTEFKLVAADP
jgi:hypothetical protein